MTAKTAVDFHGRIRREGRELVIAPVAGKAEAFKAFGARDRMRAKGYVIPPQRLQDLELMKNNGLRLGIAPDAAPIIEAWRKHDELTKLLQDAADVENHGFNHHSWPKLKGHQRVAVDYLISRERAGWCVLSPGLGKTATAIVAADIRVRGRENPRILIVAPLTLLFNWQREVMMWASPETAQAAIIYGDPPSPLEIKVGNATYFITNPDSLLHTVYETEDKHGNPLPKPKRQRVYNPAWGELHFDGVIFDESIMYKNRKARRQFAAAQLGQTVKDFVWMLTGNPTGAYCDQFFGQLSVLRPDIFTSYWRFVDHWCLTEVTPWATKIVGNKNPEGLRDYLRDIMISRNPEDLPPGTLPDLLFETIRVKLDPKQEAAIKEVEDLLQVKVNEGEIVSVMGALPELTRIKQIVAGPANLGNKGRSVKSDTALEMLETVNGPTIVWFEYIGAMKEFVKRANDAGYKGEAIWGDVSDKDRDRIITDFQGGKVDFVAIQLETGKFGLSLTAAKTVIFHDRPLNVDTWIQATHRVRRLSSNPVPAQCYILHGGHTDYMIDEILDRKMNSLGEMRISDVLKFMKGN